MSAGVSKAAAERNQRILVQLVKEPGNNACADCKRQAPQWASHNLGIFLCVTCASIHRKMGVHISKIKSLTLDSWSKEQVENMRTMGNLNSNAIYNPDERRNPPPANVEDGERGSEMEAYIRAKYERKQFLGLPKPSSGVSRPASASAHAPLSVPALPRAKSTPAVHLPKPAAVPAPPPPPTSSMVVPPPRMSSVPLMAPPQLPSQVTGPAPPKKPLDMSDMVWSDIMSINSPGAASPLSMNVVPTNPPFSSTTSAYASQGMATQPSPINPYNSLQPQTQPFPNSPFQSQMRSASLPTVFQTPSPTQTPQFMPNFQMQMQQPTYMGVTPPPSLQPNPYLLLQQQQQLQLQQQQQQFAMQSQATGYPPINLATPPQQQFAQQTGYFNPHMPFAGGAAAFQQEQQQQQQQPMYGQPIQTNPFGSVPGQGYPQGGWS